MWQEIIVGAIVAIAFIALAKRLYTMNKKSGSCGGCGSCDASKKTTAK